MASNLSDLVKKRGIIKKRQTLFKKHVDAIRDFMVASQIPDNDKIIELEGRLEKQEPLLSEFEQVQNEIELLHDNLDEQILEREMFENAYFSSMALSKRIVSDSYEFKIKQSNEQGSSNHSVISSVSHSGMLQQNQNIKLPQIQLPKFSGLYENWLEFRDTFNSLINQNSSINDIQKFHYLRASLEGGAAQIIRSLEFSENNYSVAWEALLNRYNNDNLLVYNHIKSIFDIPVLTQESASDLRKINDTLAKHLRSLKMLNQPIEYWDTLLIYIITNKLDKPTSRHWEEQKPLLTGDKNVLPNLENFQSFLKQRADLLETMDTLTATKQSKTGFRKTACNLVNTPVNTKWSCAVCNESHHIQHCQNFLKLPVNKKIEKVRNLKLCINCLRGNHSVSTCYAGGCRKCKARHNTLLHMEKTSVSQSNNTSKENSAEEPQYSTQTNVSINSSSENQTMTFSSKENASSVVLLSTALVQIKDSLGEYHTCRVLLDTASQSNLITAKLCDTLKLNKIKVNMSLMGINQVTSHIQYKCEAHIQSLFNSFQTLLSCLIVNKISDPLPNRCVDISRLDIPNHLRLADPGFGSPNQIDMLLGASLFYDLLCIGQVRLGKNQPTLQKTLLGWIISGSVQSDSCAAETQCYLSTNLDIQEQLCKFWEIEELRCQGPQLSNDERHCEDIFTKTTKRDSKGRFVVQIPFKQSPSTMGDSKFQALQRFYTLENKLSKNPNLNRLYNQFMEEYFNLGHMLKVQNQSKSSVCYYFPHHGVFNERNQTTKLRVVFDGSSRSDSGISLNELQYVGPTIQDDIVSILLRFRTHQIVICADIIKMYRQILIEPSQRSLQRIWWRCKPEHEPSIYELQTVTYGTASAPWLAVRCLKQLALDCKESCPRASKIIRRDFYMDDLLTGAKSETEAVQLCNEITNVLRLGGFELQKWASNSPVVLNHVKGLNPSTNLKLGDNEKTKTLGLYWNCSNDTLMYSIGNYKPLNLITKRSILSDIAQIYDPLGLLSPCIIIAKVILQKLWMYKLSWDEALPADLDTKWRNMRQELEILNDLQTPRWIFNKNTVKRELHGFADASLEAYGACLYVRSVNGLGEITVQLLCSKTRVAPLKSISIPRLELCGALVLANLVMKVETSLNIEFDECFLWSDSTVCLNWIRTPPSTLQTFVGNRVSQIQTLTNPSMWNHIRSEDNPADLLSRGVSPRKIQNSLKWWQGPGFLLQPQQSWPKGDVKVLKALPEVKRKATLCQVAQIEITFPFEQFSNLNRLKRVVAYCLRFGANCKSKRCEIKPLTTHELNHAMKCLVKIAQRQSFALDMENLKTNKRVSNRLTGLCPIFDEDHILRVGGRLQQSQLSYDQKHPALLSSQHRLTRLIFESEHLRLHHAGPQLLLYSIREKYWSLGGRNLARKVVRGCIRCFRVNPISSKPMMGDLPRERVCPAPAFTTTGVDYAGPLLIKSKPGRGGSTIKAYICLFVCFTTKAIHLELVSDLTKELFIAAFRRFTSRRGKPQTVYSDNGTNFVGANNELRELARFLRQQQVSIQESVCNSGVNWNFIPAFSPHMGGIWEAGVKSCKAHLKRVLANTKLTFEEMYTVLTEIEAILNSRPIQAMSSDPNDMSSLTPSHFLIGQPLTTLPDPSLKDIPCNKLTRYQLLQQMQQHFWTRWSKEYITELQQRTKWKKHQRDLAPGQLVVIKNHQTQPLNWQLGRVVEVHPGPDGTVRVATIATSAGVLLKRSCATLCVLPSED